MAEVFATKETVFFVGGIGTKAGNSKAGGCTKAFYDTYAGQGILDYLMGANGAPIGTSPGASYNTTTGVITEASEDDFLYAVPGMVLYMEGAEVISGRYEILSVGPGTVTIDTALGNDDDNTLTICNLGGAFDTLQHAVDNTDASDYDVSILTNKDETPGATVSITSAGSVTKNTKLHIIGYNTNPPSDAAMLQGDMDYGGAYYQSPIDSYNDGISATGFVKLDADGGAYPVITIDGADNVVLRNLYLYNTEANSSPEDAIYPPNTPEGLTVINCRFDSVYQVLTTGGAARFIGCANGDDCAVLLLNLATGSSSIDCVWQTPSSTASGTVGIQNGVVGTFIGNIIIGGVYGIRAAGIALVKNNVFYNQSTAGVWVGNAAGIVTAYNNIMVIQADGHGILVGANGGTIAYNDYNCIVDVNGDPLDDPVKNDYSGGMEPIIGSHSIKVDPKFINAAGSDFRLRPGSPCLNTGRPAPDDGFVSIGAWQRKSLLMGAR